MNFPETPEELKRFVEQEVLTRGTFAIRLRQFRGPECTTATLPADPAPGDVVFVSDGAAGSKFQGYDGAGWVSLG